MQRVWFAVVAVGACSPAPAPRPSPPVGPAASARPTAPAGTLGCPHRDATTAEAAALACYRDRIRPALAALASSPELAHYSFGSADYLTEVLALVPTVRRETTASELPPEDPLTRVLGGRPTPRHQYTIVDVSLHEVAMPTDGGFDLVLYVDDATLDVVIADRRLGG